MLFAHRAGVDVPAQRSAPDDPVPRWSKTTRSRVPSAAAMFCAIFAALAACAAHELRRLRALTLVPDAPGVPSLRDRPG
jgi:hypothetical protein